MLVRAWKVGAAGRDQAGRRLLDAAGGYLYQMARHFARATGCDIEDLLQEGKEGYLLGVDRFDLERGFRLSTYAIHWARARMQEYAVRYGPRAGAASFGTSHMARKVLFHRASAALRLEERGEDVTPEAICDELGVTRAHVATVHYVRARPHEIDKEGVRTVLRDPRHVEGSVVAADLRAKVRRAFDRADLDPRERRIIQARYLEEDVATLEDLGRELVRKKESGGNKSDRALSRERVRQLEARALGKLREAFEDEGLDEAA